MIAHIRPLDADTAVAGGPKFDTDRVLASAVSFMRGFLKGVRAAAGGCDATVSFPPDLHCRYAFDDTACLRMRRAILAESRRYDVSTAAVIFVCRAYRIKLYPLGGDALTTRMTAWRTMSDAPGAQLDPTPYLQVVPSDGKSLFFPERQANLLADLLKQHAPTGAEVLGPRADGPNELPGLRFPHAAFSAGHGELRIARVASLPSP